MLSFDFEDKLENLSATILTPTSPTYLLIPDSETDPFKDKAMESKPKLEDHSPEEEPLGR